MADNWMLGETAALDDYIPTLPSNVFGNAATAVKDWYAAQPSWLDRAKAENQRTAEAYQRGGMGEIARQLATDTTEAQDLASGFGGNIKGVKPPLAPGALAAVDQYHPPFYSAVEQAVQGAKQNAAPGQQWAGFLRNQPGVKPEEVEALKLGKLFEQPGSVPKEAVLGEIAANRVNVGEVIKSEQTQRPAAQRVNSIDDRLHDIQSEFDRLHQFGNAAASERRAALAAQERELRTERAGIVANWQDQASGRTKFQQYTLPGGESYREMLLTLPTEDAPKAARMTALEGKLRNAGDYDTHEVNAMRREYKQLADETRASGTFKSPHYDEPNILAHVRYNDRVIDGKKTLFVEEVQSDWHQKGKREGYKEPYKISELSEVPAGDPVASDPSRFWYVRAPDNVFQIAKQHTPTFQGAVDYIVREKSKGGGTVPDAPFKTTWPELAMKRIIREAAEKGYDKVAWTPGSVQAERYDLSKHIDHVSFNHNPTNKEPGKIYVAAHPHGGGHPVIQGNFTPKEIEANLGKEIADQIVNGKDTYGAIQKEGLKVGGEGMKGFYDEILPATVNKLVKKHGGRVMQGELRTAEENPLVFKLKDNGYDPDTVDIQQILADNGGRLPRWLNDAELNAINMGEHLDIAGIKGDKVHTLDITPSLRAAAMKGFPLFTAGGVAATGIMGEMARQDEYR